MPTTATAQVFTKLTTNKQQTVIISYVEYDAIRTNVCRNCGLKDNYCHEKVQSSLKPQPGTSQILNEIACTFTMPIFIQVG